MGPRRIQLVHRVMNRRAPRRRLAAPALHGGIRMRRQFDDVMLGSLELFCLAAELESFTAAAQAAGLNPPAVSRAIARLESRLGVNLFVRTTRQIHLTDSGRIYYEQCRQALTLMRDAESQLTGEHQAPSGLL